MRPTAERIRELLDYNPLTGVFIWKHRANGPTKWNTKWAGKVAGSQRGNGYIAIAIDGVKYLAQQLAWAYMTGDWPSSFVDHRNLDKSDYRFDNLRLASFGESSANISVRKSSKSGFRGVCFSKQKNLWRARLNKEGVEYHIGFFGSAKGAGIAYAKKATEVYGEYCPEYLRALACQ
jgi:hypothetical protein